MSLCAGQVTPCRSTRVRLSPAAPQRSATSLSTTAQKTDQGQETAEKVDAKLNEVFDNIAGAEDKIAAGNLEHKTDMEERQKDPSFAEAKDALDLNKDDPGASTTPAGQEQGQCSN